MSFIYNAWYVAEWADELKSDEIKNKKMLNQNVVIYRDKAGSPVVLEDLCPHRLVPLRMGKVVNDNIECCYHGLQFDPTGQCVRNPHEPEKIPKAMRIKSYPTKEKHGAIWVWMGNEAADDKTIPDYSKYDEGAGYKIKRGYTNIAANYGLIADNLLDLSHVTYVHPGVLGTPEMIGKDSTLRQEGEWMWNDRFLKNVSVPRNIDLLFKNDGRNVDAWQDMGWYPPSSYLINAGATCPGDKRENGIEYHGIHFLTPETESTTHYHFAAALPPYLNPSPEVLKELGEMRRFAFHEQDKPIIEAQQLVMASEGYKNRQQVLIPKIDAAAVRMRRTIEDLLDKEQI